MTKVNTFWIGREMGEIHAACLRSFLRQGHEVVLHAYGKPSDTPKGVQLFDARKIMKEEEIFSHKESGSLSIASDIYRYRIQREGMGLYVDCDVYCIKPFEDRDYIFSWESNTIINTAILKIPHDSCLLKSILQASEDPYFIPPWVSKRRQFRYALRKKLGFPKHVSDQSWGVIGPLLLTYHAKRLGLEELAAAIDIYSPVYGILTNLLFEEGLSVKDVITPRTLGLHLYNSGLSKAKIKENTPIYEIINS